jgi:hypothetical protein
MSLLFIKVLVRCIAALFVACVASFATILLGFSVMFSIIPDNFGQFLEISLVFTLFAITGFMGVFSGTLCLEQKSRRFGAIVLLAVGLGFSAWFWVSFPSGGKFHWLPYYIWPLMVGGTAAVLLIWFKSRKKENRIAPIKP